MNMPTLPLLGACLCGNVRINVNKMPLLTLACHCNDCQKLTASAFSLTVMVPADGITMTGEMERGGLKNAERNHHFCVCCKNFVYTQIKGAPERVNLRATLFDDLAWFTPFVELMRAEKRPWVRINATHRFERFPATSDELNRLLCAYAQNIRQN